MRGVGVGVGVGFRVVTKLKYPVNVDGAYCVLPLKVTVTEVRPSGRPFVRNVKIPAPPPPIDIPVPT